MNTQVTGCPFVQTSAAYVVLNHIYELGLSSLRHMQATNTKATAITISTGSPKLRSASLTQLKLSAQTSLEQTSKSWSRPWALPTPPLPQPASGRGDKPPPLQQLWDGWLLPVSVPSLLSKRKAHIFLSKGKAAPDSCHRQTGDRLCHLLGPVQTCCMG